ncbi:DUF2971 domain-containing protein [Pseudomonas mosselii]|uniref:DUF2971 domain-containing protein n=1 Tax=Pseudomonas mosselii TaxID=78327 RepID=UPI001E2CC613|nr:DUF2971 domain-containing protein [Pseudomonas mosselii]MCL8298900.1 DUF2971 domain-containing protein [Pseudomonas mosselii]MCL8339087.1 DUF2971 domain-containing protein [Pseudomonas mosselii]WJR29430.1 DUF2971 domain-containing protein [Pseudomonas mosselii]
MFYTDDFMYDVMGIERLPERLYHYTSVDTLGLILANQTLRFARLDGVNDPEEAMAEDLPLASTLVFTSSWTAEAKESLPMWSMYTGLTGVRIALPINPFRGRRAPTVYEKGGAMQTFDGRVSLTREGDSWHTYSSMVFGPNKIYYTDDLPYRNGSCLLADHGTWSVQLHDLGMVKNTHWSYEKEWRFKVIAAPFEVQLKEPDPLSHPFYDLKQYPVREKWVDLPLDPSCLAEIEVVLGPKVSEEQARRVEALLAAHAPGGRILRSTIKIR